MCKQANPLSKNPPPGKNESSVIEWRGGVSSAGWPRRLADAGSDRGDELLGTVEVADGVGLQLTVGLNGASLVGALGIILAVEDLD